VVFTLFCRKYLEKATEQGGYRQVKVLCKVKEEKKIFAFDEGGSQYGIMTMNISEVFNFVLKGIHSLSVSAIVDYTFHKCNKYFMSR
jgi:hypothetical protein